MYLQKIDLEYTSHEKNHNRVCVCRALKHYYLRWLQKNMFALFFFQIKTKEPTHRITYLAKKYRTPMMHPTDSK